MLSKEQKVSKRIADAFGQVRSPEAEKTLRGMQLIIEARGAHWTPREFDRLLQKLDTLLAKEQSQTYCPSETPISIKR